MSVMEGLDDFMLVSDGQVVAKGTKIKFNGDRATNKFPSLQGKVISSKGSLTKAIKLLDRAAATFNGLNEDEEELMTLQRHAKGVMDAMEKVESRKTGVEDCYDTLVDQLNSMNRSDFEPETDPVAISNSAEFSCQEKTQEAEGKLEEHEVCIKRAEKILSMQLLTENVVHCPFSKEPAPASVLPIFRGQSDLKPPPIEKSST